MKYILIAIISCVSACAQQQIVQEPSCRAIVHAEQPFTVCSYDAGADIRLHHTHSDGGIIGQFGRLADDVSAEGGTLIFAMNAGMYHSDRSPVGLFVEDEQQLAPIVTREGPGNFGMLPNGVFSIDQNGQPHVTETLAYREIADEQKSATQSGPMLVIDGVLHPKFNPEGTSRKRRNGVGVSADGETIHFAISDSFVTFHEFATLFRDVLDTPNALYLDGTISRMYAPEIGRNEDGLDMGPIVSVVK